MSKPDRRAAAMRGGKPGQEAAAAAAADERLLELARCVDRCIEEFFPRRLDAKALRRYVGAPAWKHDPGASSEGLCAPIWDLLDRRGKRWRPVFGMLLLEALGVDPEPFASLLSITGELYHTGSLIIDDIEDASLRRRNGPCIHVTYGEAVAINAANTLYFLPFLHVYEHPVLDAGKKDRIVEIMIRTSVRAHMGQGLDIHWSRRLTPSDLEAWLADELLDKVLQAYHYKTGALVEGIAEVVSLIACAGAGVARVCMSFARDLAVAFQIMDDIHNFSESAGWTKCCGEDLAEGKLSYVVVSAVNRLQGEDRARLAGILCDREQRRAEAGLREGMALVRKSGALDTCCIEAQSLADRAWEELTNAVQSSASCEALRRLTMGLMCVCPPANRG